MDTVVTFLLFGFLGLSTLVGIAGMIALRSPHDRIGRGGTDAGGRTGEDSAAVREEDVRQMLEARARRRVARGEPAGDVNRELQALLEAQDGPGAVGPDPSSAPAPSSATGAEGAPSTDPPPSSPPAGRDETWLEARAIAEGRNARRRRRGQPLVDLDEETAAILRSVGDDEGAPGR